MGNRTEVISDCELMRKSLIAKNTSTAQSQDAYLKEYNDLNKRYEAAADGLRKLKNERACTSAAISKDRKIYSGTTRKPDGS